MTERKAHTKIRMLSLTMMMKTYNRWYWFYAKYLFQIMSRRKFRISTLSAKDDSMSSFSLSAMILPFTTCSAPLCVCTSYVIPRLALRVDKNRFLSGVDKNRYGNFRKVSSCGLCSTHCILHTQINSNTLTDAHARAHTHTRTHISCSWVYKKNLKEDDWRISGASTLQEA